MKSTWPKLPHKYELLSGNIEYYDCNTVINTNNIVVTFLYHLDLDITSSISA